MVSPEYPSSVFEFKIDQYYDRIMELEKIIEKEEDQEVKRRLISYKDFFIEEIRYNRLEL